MPQKKPVQTRRGEGLHSHLSGFGHTVVPLQDGSMTLVYLSTKTSFMKPEWMGECCST